MKMRKMELLILFLAVSLIAGTAGADITTGLQGYWPLDEGTGTTTADASGNENHGTFAGTPTWDNGPEGFGSALFFDVGPSADGVDCGEGCNPIKDTGQFSLAHWAYWRGTEVNTNYDHQFLVCKGYWGTTATTYHSGLGGPLAAEPRTNRLLFHSSKNSPTMAAFSLMPKNEWVHLVFTFDGSNLSLYMNGVPDGTGSQPFIIGTPEESTGKFVIGECFDLVQRSFDGYLDEVRVYNRVLSQADVLEVMAPLDAATNIAPANGAQLVAVETDLVWGPPSTFTPTKYDLRYKVGDPNFAIGDITVVPDIAHTDPCNVYNPPADFANETTVYWRVDSYAPSYPSDPCIGNTWNFTTAPAGPVITEDPCSLTVALGATAVFRVKDVNGVNYTWKRQSDNVTVGGNSPVLTLTDVQKDPCEDFYRCIVSKTGTPDAQSAWAALWTKRLIARWEFEDDLADSEADGWDGDYTDPNTANEPPTPVFASGIEGQALSLVADALHVRITDSEDFFNFYPLGYTVNTWVKTEQAGVYGCIASKQDRGDEMKGWVLNCTNTGKAVSSLRQVNAAVSITDINDDQWHMVTGTYDAEAGVVAVYVDGKLESESAPSSDVAPMNDYPVVLGAETVFAELAVYEGLLDKTSIYSYALSPFDVAVLYTDVAGGEICLEQPEYDFNEDCRVDILDFAIFATSWLECNLVPDCLP
jgi:Concanavalin A-like lectin/glucanases superfamily